MTAAIKSTSKGKATGLDNIPAEVWKSGALLDQLLEVCNKAFITGDCPLTWHKAAIIPIPKKGDLSNRQNYSIYKPDPSCSKNLQQDAT